MNRQGANHRLSVCFVAPKSYGNLTGRADLMHIGGSEIQQPMIGRELSRRGYDISFITYDHPEPDGIRHDGIRIFKMCRPEDGIPLLRFFHPRWTSLASAMRRADADFYYQQNAGTETGQIAFWCKRSGRRFVLAAASDSDCDPGLRYLETRRERIFYRYALRHAAVVIAQTQNQVEMFKEGIGIDTTLIRSCSADPIGGACLERTAPPPGKPRLLWVGRFATEKRPEVLLDLAGVCPKYEFDLVGDSTVASAYADAIRERAAQCDNVTLHGRVPHHEMDQYYEQATALLCTSSWEGYPNTFMEAWARGIPTVSTVDPDQVVSANLLGGVGHDVAQLKTIIDKLVQSPQEWRRCSERSRRFFVDNHTINATVNSYEALFAAMSSSSDGSPACPIAPTVSTREAI